MNPTIAVPSLGTQAPAASARTTYALLAGAMALFVLHGIVVELARTPTIARSESQRITASGEDAAESRALDNSRSSPAGEVDQTAGWQNMLALLGAAAEAERSREQQMLRETIAPTASGYWSYAGQREAALNPPPRLSESRLYPTETGYSARIPPSEAAALSSVRPNSYYGQQQSPWGASGMNELQRSSGYPGYSALAPSAPPSPALGSARGYDYYNGSGFAGSSRPNYTGGRDFYGAAGQLGTANPNYAGGHDFYGPGGYLGSSSPNYLGGQNFSAPGGFSAQAVPNYSGGYDYYGPSGFMGSSRPNYSGGYDFNGSDGSSMSSVPNR